MDVEKWIINGMDGTKYFSKVWSLKNVSHSVIKKIEPKWFQKDGILTISFGEK